MGEGEGEGEAEVEVEEPVVGTEADVLPLPAQPARDSTAKATAACSAGLALRFLQHERCLLKSVLFI